MNSSPVTGLLFLFVLLGLATSMFMEAIAGWYLSLIIYTFIEILITSASGSPVVQPANAIVTTTATAITTVVPLPTDLEPAEGLPEDDRADGRQIELRTSDVRIKVNVQEWNQNNH